MDNKTETFNCCSSIFEELFIGIDGDLDLCCSYFLLNSKIGNIYNDDLEECWNGEKIRKYRRAILNNDYSNCRLKDCSIKNDKSSTDFKEIMPYPKHIRYGVDKTCNFNCKMCYRNKELYKERSYRPNEIYLLYMYDQFINKVLPYMSNCETFLLANHGEAFYSKHYFDVIKIVRDTHPEHEEFKKIMNLDIVKNNKEHFTGKLTDFIK